MSGERDEELDVVDALIDETARSLTRGEAPAALRSRVRASMATPPPRRVLVWAPATAATAAAVIAVAAWLVMHEAPVTPRNESAPPVMGRSEPPDAAVRREVASPLARVEQADAPERPRAPVVVLSAERVTPAADLLPVIEPIEIEPVPSSAMSAVERLALPTPLAMDAITIERLFE